jgi:hypothetical protein
VRRRGSASRSPFGLILLVGPLGSVLTTTVQAA